MFESHFELFSHLSPPPIDGGGVGIELQMSGVAITSAEEGGGREGGGGGGTAGTGKVKAAFVGEK